MARALSGSTATPSLRVVVWSVAWVFGGSGPHSLGSHLPPTGASSTSALPSPSLRFLICGKGVQAEATWQGWGGGELNDASLQPAQQKGGLVRVALLT